MRASRSPKRRVPRSNAVGAAGSSTSARAGRRRCASGRADEHPRRAGDDAAAHEDRVRAAERVVGPTPSSSGCFSTGHASPVSDAWLTKKWLADRTRPSAGTRSPADSSTTSPGDERDAGDLAGATVAPRADAQGDSAAQGLHRAARAMLLHHVEGDAHQHDDDDEDEAHRVAGERGDRRCAEQDEDERIASRLSDRARQSRPVGSLAVVRAFPAQARRRFASGQPFGTRVQAAQEDGLRGPPPFFD